MLITMRLRVSFNSQSPPRIIRREVSKGGSDRKLKNISVQIKCESDAGRIEKYMCLLFIEQ
jgi:hypothetical protein